LYYQIRSFGETFHQGGRDPVITQRREDCFLPVQIENLIETQQGRGEAIGLTLHRKQSGAFLITAPTRTASYRVPNQAFIPLGSDPVSVENNRCDGIRQDSALIQLFERVPFRRQLLDRLRDRQREASPSLTIAWVHNQRQV
jgi:hypothetical protein